MQACKSHPYICQFHAYDANYLSVPETNWPKFKGKNQGQEAEVLIEMKHNVEQVKPEDNPILHQLLKTCLTFPKKQGTFAYTRRFFQSTRKNSKIGQIGLSAAISNGITWVRQNTHQVCQKRSECYVQESSIHQEQWRTRLSEIAYVINGCPLNTSSKSIWESLPITSNDILIGHHLPLPQPETEERKTYSQKHSRTG